MATYVRMGFPIQSKPVSIDSAYGTCFLIYMEFLPFYLTILLCRINASYASYAIAFQVYYRKKMKCDGKWCKSNSTEISDPTLANMYLGREYGTTELVKRINSALAFIA